MTDKEKLIKIKSLADKMYNAAFNLTTDASLLRKAMEEYHQFIIYKYHKEETVSEELIIELKSIVNIMELAHQGIPVIKIACHIANWQKEKDQETIELAEDHAMLAGMEKMKEEMMAKAVETTFNVSLPSGLYDKLLIKGCKEGDKLLVIKKDEL